MRICQFPSQKTLEVSRDSITACRNVNGRNYKCSCVGCIKESHNRAIRPKMKILLKFILGNHLHVIPDVCDFVCSGEQNPIILKMQKPLKPPQSKCFCHLLYVHQIELHHAIQKNTESTKHHIDLLAESSKRCAKQPWTWRSHGSQLSLSFIIFTF